MRRIINEDWIIKEIQKLEVKNEENGTWLVDSNAVLAAIASAPPTGLMPERHGRWILDPHGRDWNLPGWVCSECKFTNELIPVYIPGIGEVKDPNAFEGSRYCPNCGSRMDLPPVDYISKKEIRA